MSITLLEIRQQARDRADMKDSQFVEDSELTNYVNSSIAELHDIMVQAYGTNYFTVPYEFTTAADQTDYSLPTDFYKLDGVDCKLNGSDWTSLKRFNFPERNRFSDSAPWNRFGTKFLYYRLVGANVSFSPVPDANTAMKLWYTPVATKLVDDTDTLDDLNQYVEYVIVDAAIKMMQKEESDVSVLFAQKQALLKRIQEAAQNRDSGEPESVSDVYADNTEWWYKG